MSTTDTPDPEITLPLSEMIDLLTRAATLGRNGELHPAVTYDEMRTAVKGRMKSTLTGLIMRTERAGR